MKIRRAVTADRPRIAAIQTQSWQSAYAGVLPPDYLAGQLAGDLARHWQAVAISDSDIVLVAMSDDDIVGFIAVWVDPDPLIDNLHVLPGRRSAGIGRALMAAAADALEAGGHSRAHLWVVAENVRAIRFYERLGGRIVERADYMIFGNAVPSLRIEWSDLRRIGNS